MIYYDKLPDKSRENLEHDATEIAEFNEIKAQIDGMFPNNTLNKVLTDESGVVEYDLRYDENGEIEITRDGLHNWHVVYDKSGKVKKSLPKSIKTALGEEAEVIIDRNETTIVAKDAEILELTGRENPLAALAEANKIISN
jgi:hypothetical protein